MKNHKIKLSSIFTVLLFWNLLVGLPEVGFAQQSIFIDSSAGSCSDVAPTNTGTGTCTISNVSAFNVTETITFTATSSGGGATFTVVGSVSGSLGTVTAGSTQTVTDAYGFTKFSVNLSNGGTPYASGDNFRFTVTGGSELRASEFNSYTTFQDSQPDLLKNVGLSTSVGSSALTITVVDRTGSALSSTNIASIAFRTNAAALSTYNIRTIAAAGPSVVIPSGATLGQSNATEAFLLVWGIDNSGSIELGVSGVGYQNTSGVGSSTAISAASSSASTLYSTSARSSLPVRLLGVIRNTQTTAGTWASAGSSVHLAGPASTIPSNYSFILPTTKPTTDQILKFDGSNFVWSSATTTYSPSAKSADYTITDSDNISIVLMTTSNTARTVTLPNVANNSGRTIGIKKVDSGTGTVSVARAGSATIDGVTSVLLISRYEEVQLISDGTNWHIVSQVVNTTVSGSRTSASGQALSTATDTNALASPVAVGPGKWRVSAYMGFAPAATTTITQLQAGVATTSATLNQSQRANPSSTGEITVRSFFASYAPAGDVSLQLGSYDVSLTASSTNFYLVARSVFATSTLECYGYLSFTRMSLI